MRRLAQLQAGKAGRAGGLQAGRQAGLGQGGGMSHSEGGGQKVAGDGARNVSFTADTAGRERLAQADRCCVCVCARAH